MTRKLFFQPCSTQVVRISYSLACRRMMNLPSHLERPAKRPGVLQDRRLFMRTYAANVLPGTMLNFGFIRCMMNSKWQADGEPAAGDSGEPNEEASFVSMKI